MTLKTSVITIALFSLLSAGKGYCQDFKGIEAAPRDSLNSAVWQRGYTVNPTSYHSLDIDRQTEVAASYRYSDSDGLNSPFEGDGGDRFGIYAKGYGVQRRKSIYSGMAGFSTGTHRNTRWTDVSDVWMLYPYLVGDIKGGDYIDESYRLSGSYSLYLGHHIVGLKVRYTGEMAHRGSDPRPKNTVSELVLNPGWTWRIDERNSVGAFLEYTYYKQHVSISVEETSYSYVFYLIRGVGLYDRMFSKGGTSFGRYYFSDGIAAGLQWEKSGKNAFEVIAKFRYRNIDTEESDNRIPYITSRIGAELHGGYRRTMGRSALTVTAEVEMWQQKGYERVYERVESDQQTGVQVWRLLSETMRDKITNAAGRFRAEYRQGVSDKLHLWYGLNAGYSSWEERFTSPQYHMAIDDIRFSADVGLRLEGVKKNAFTAHLSAGHKANADASLTAPSGESEIVAQNMLLPLYEYLKKDYTETGVSIGYEFPVKNLRMTALAQGGYAFAQGGDKRWVASLGLSVSL